MRSGGTALTAGRPKGQAHAQDGAQPAAKLWRLRLTFHSSFLKRAPRGFGGARGVGGLPEPVRSGFPLSRAQRGGGGAKSTRCYA